MISTVRVDMYWDSLLYCWPFGNHLRLGNICFYKQSLMVSIKVHAGQYGANSPHCLHTRVLTDIWKKNRNHEYINSCCAGLCFSFSSWRFVVVYLFHAFDFFLFLFWAYRVLNYLCEYAIMCQGKADAFINGIQVSSSLGVSCFFFLNILLFNRYIGIEGMS